LLWIADDELLCVGWATEPCSRLCLCNMPREEAGSRKRESDSYI